MITPRLDMILRHVSGKSCADIGTDHAYIPIKLSERGMHVIATDIRPGPLEMARTHVKKHGASVELRLGAGLEPIAPGETDTIIIAGMGGEMIVNILKASPETAKKSRLILQPMNSQSELRSYLSENGFRITDEDLAVEGFKVYNLIVAEQGEGDSYAREIDLHLPKRLYSHPHFERLLAKKKRELTKIMQGLERSADSRDEEIAHLKKLLNQIEEISEEVL